MAVTEFHSPNHYGYTTPPQYRFLPFRFDRRADGTVFMVNEAGEFLVLLPVTFHAFTAHALTPADPQYFDLKAKHFLSDDQSSAHLDVLAAKYRTKKSFIEDFTKLHIFVTTLRCDQSCPYCQVSRQGQDASANVYDMSYEVLEKSVRLMLAAPASHVTMEFQGGEPLLNFELIKEAVELSKVLNEGVNKIIDYVICTNLTMLTDEHLAFCENHNILISTSVDGPAELHDKNRPLRGRSSHALVTRNIRRCQEALGTQSVSALMTTTRASLQYPKAIVDEYLRLDLGSLFVRELNPYGFASRSAAAIGYDTQDFLFFYRQILDYILEINCDGCTFSESYATMILSKILTPWPIGFVDLQSPSGAGIGVCVYNYDGDLYASDESRMLAEVGDTTFRLGNVLKNTYEEIFFGDTMQTIAAASCNEALAGCSDCAYQSYCGADPVRHYRSQLDLFGNRATRNGFCTKNMAIIKHLLNFLIEGDADIERIFWAWINYESIERLQLPEV